MEVDPIKLIGPVIVLMAVLGFVTFAILFERKVLGWMQSRPGPTHVGPWGMFQTVADVLKLLIKEDVIPTKADRPLFKIAPVIAFVPSFAVIAVIPFAPSIVFADLGVGLLYFIAVSGITTIGVLVGGWASNNKYALLGSMRSVAQMISYEIPLVLSIIGIIMAVGSLNMSEIIVKQEKVWFIVPQFLGFIVFFVAMLAELARTPFDLPEADSELVAGYHVEYSGFRFAFFMLAEYVYVFAMSALTTILFLGGWNPLFGLTFIPPIVWFILKMLATVFVIFWIRASLPRVRLDQLMQMGWKVLLPLAMVNIFLSALLKEVPFVQAFF